jgi:dTDP-4-amino-4,6-dideoxygalactose transaminase
LVGKAIVLKVPYYPFNHIPEKLISEWKTAIDQVIESGVFIGGSFVEHFESEWSTFIKCERSVSVGNGFDGLRIALEVLGVSKGMKVVVPAHTFIATWLSVKAVGATPVGVDVDRNGLMDLDKLEALNDEVDAIIPVHMHGAMVNMPRLLNWAKPKKVKVVEDASQAHGANLDGKSVGTWGDAGVFSLYPTKNLGALGDAGIIVFADQVLASRAKSLRNYGAIEGKKYDYESLGLNSRLDPIQAAVLSVNLKYLNEWNDKRIKIANMYEEHLNENIKKLQPAALNSVRHHFPILVPNPEQVARVLNEKGIGVERHYPETAARSYAKVNRIKDSIPYPIADSISSSTLSLPISPWHTEDQISYVMESLNMAIADRSIEI